MAKTLSQNVALFLLTNRCSSLQLAEKLRSAQVILNEIHTLPQLQEELISNKHQLCVTHYDKIDESYFELIEFIREHKLPTKVIVSSKLGTIEDAVQCIKSGAIDFIVGDLTDARLVESILKTTTNYQAILPVTTEHIPSNSTEEKALLVGQSPAICEIRSAVNLVAKSQTTVLITGESGTGKEIVARLIHLQSNRAENQFIAINCATLPKDVIENELFGHEKGAFTGATPKKPGCFELADDGTLLFDEIAEMSLETQAKLLRVIETQKFRRLGGREEVTVNVRMIAATNKNISSALKLKELREDLYYRLSVIEIFIPPLRERKEDTPLLIEYFLSIFANKYGKQQQQFTSECLEMLNSYNWPGNVRELRNVVERALVICPHETIGPHYLPERIQRQIMTPHNINIPLGSSAQEAERILFLQTLASAGNNKAKAAKILGISRKTLHNKLTSFQHS